MNEHLLIDLMGDIDVSLLKDDTIEQDLDFRSFSRIRGHKMKKQQGGGGFLVVDTLRNSILNQIDKNDLITKSYQHVSKEELESQIDCSFQVVRGKVNRLTGIISGVAAMLLVITSVIVFFVRKKYAKFAVL